MAKSYDNIKVHFIWLESRYWLSLRAVTLLEKLRICLQISSELNNVVLRCRWFSFGWINPFYRKILHCLKRVRIRSYSAPHFSVLGLNMERYEVSLHIQSKCWKMRTRITPNTDTFHAELISSAKTRLQKSSAQLIQLTSFYN